MPLTYADRLKAMRETKIRHTLEKRTQNGYTNLDDFGTVPISEGYFVEPWYNSENGSFYGFDGMSENFCRVINAHDAYVDPNEMLCGRWRDMLVNYRGDVHYLPDWLKNNPKTQELMKSATTTWSKRWDESRFPYDELKPYHELYNIQTGIDGDAHFACDYTIGLELGFGGLLDKIEKYRKINTDKTDFYDAEEKCLKAIISFVDRHIEKIQELIQTETRPEIIENLKEMLAVNKKIRLGKPETLHEVCQWVAYFNCASRIYTRDGAGFQLDTVLLPYYENDIKNGIINNEKAKFLIANLLLIDPHYYQISGVDENDRDLTNPLSYLILEAADSINIACNLTVRVHKNCDSEFLKKSVYYLLKNKNAWPRFANDDALCNGYMKAVSDKSIARKRIAVGCNWMCIPGIEFPMNDTVKINIAKVFSVALDEMRESGEYSTEKLFSIYEKHLKKAAQITAKGINLHLDHQWEVTPELIMNLMMKDSIETGVDASLSAQLHTVGIDGAGLAVVADSFGALEERIENEKLLSWEDMFEAISSNYTCENGTRIRAILSSAGKYCHGMTPADSWAKRLTDSFVKIIRDESSRMPKSRQLIPGWFSWARTIEYGSKVPATPNGRLAGEPISHGANPNPGFRRDGAVTAQSNGIASVQCGFGNTAPLQIEFDPGVNIDNGGIELVMSLIKGHFDLGGTLININVLDTEKLLEAHKNPDLHPDLVVRVTGFTAYFASLSPDFRELVVSRFLSESKKH